MKCRLFLLTLFLSSAALAESGAYRVELIIFRNLDVVTEAVKEDELRSFSHYPGLEIMQPVEESFDIPTYLPDDLAVVTQKSTRMDGTWRRLRSSQGYRPLLYTAWQQNRTDYYPPMRVHNERIIDTQLRPPTNIVVADLAAEDPLAAYRSTFYQLDGSVQLRRSRFLHLYLDLEYRDENTGEIIEAEKSDLLQDTNELPEATNVNQFARPHEIFRLKENRQVRTGQLQYFDTPHFGALVLVTPISAPVVASP